MLKRIHHFLYRSAIVWKMAAASAISWEAAKLAGSTHPYLAPLSVILCLQVTVDKSLLFGIQRILGTIAGVLFTVYIAPYVGMNAWSLGLLILVSAALIHGIGFDKVVINQVALSILLVLYFQGRDPGYTGDRIRDTVIGCAVAIVIHIFVFPPNFTKQAIEDLYTYTDRLSDRFRRVSQWLNNGCAPAAGIMIQNDARSLFDELQQTIDQFSKAEKSLQYHPFVQKSRALLQQYHGQLLHLKQGYAHLTGMLRTLSEWSSSGRMTTEDRTLWGGRMHAIAEHLHNWKQNIMLLEQGKSGYFTPAADVSVLETMPAALALPASSEDARFAFALHNDTLQLLQDFK